MPSNNGRNRLRRSFDDQANAAATSYRENLQRALQVRSTFEALAELTHRQAEARLAAGDARAPILSCLYDDIPGNQLHVFVIASNADSKSLARARDVSRAFDESETDHNAYLRYFFHTDSEFQLPVVSIKAMAARGKDDFLLESALGHGPSDRVTHNVIMESLSHFLSAICPPDIASEITESIRMASLDAPRSVRHPANDM